MASFFRILYSLTRLITFLFSAASLLALILLIGVFLLQFIPHPREITAQVPQQYHLIIKLESSTYAALEPLRKAIPTHFKFKTSEKGKTKTVDVELSPFIAFFALLMVRFFLQAELWRIMDYAKKRIKPRARPVSERREPPRLEPSRAANSITLEASGGDQIFEGEGILFPPEQKGGGAKAKVSMRLTLMTEISRAKRMLEASKKYLAFLAVDVVKSTQMKEGEDEVAIGYTFMAYKTFIESILVRHKVWKQAWTPDGLMAAFDNMGQAVSAAQEILRRLGEFNKNHSQLKTPFQLRLGAHGGELYFDASDNLEEVSDHGIDVTGHLQKEADINTLLTTLADAEALEERSRFRRIGKRVDGYTLCEWGLAGSIGEFLRKYALISEEQLDEAIKEQERSSKPIGRILIEKGFLEEDAFLEVLGKQLKVATVKVDHEKVETEVLRRLPKELAEKFLVFPLSFRDEVLEVVSDSFIEAQLVRELEASLGLKINQEVIASRNSICLAIEQGYSRLAATEKLD